MSLCGSQQIVENFSRDGIPDHLTCLLRNLYAGQEPMVRTEHGITDWFKIGKGVPQSCTLSPCLFNLYASCKMPGWVSHKLESDCWDKYQQPQIWRWYHSNGRKSRGTKEPLDEGEKGEWKSQLKTQHSKNWIHSIQSHHFMAIKGEKVGAVTDYFFLGSKITADGDSSLELKDACSLEGKLWQTQTAY